MTLEELATVFGALAAFLAFGSMLAHATLGKYIKRLASLMVVMQWLLAALSVAAAVVAIWFLLAEPRSAGTLILAFALLGLGGIVIALLAALVLERVQPEPATTETTPQP